MKRLALLILVALFSVAAHAQFVFNAPTLPNIGSNFGATGPFANYVLVGSIPKQKYFAQMDCENLSGAQVLLLRHDGTATTGQQPKNVFLVVLAPGASLGAQGGSIAMDAGFQIDIYAPSASAFVSCGPV
jgi:hypothetical protein